MKVYTREEVRLLCERKTIHSVTCDQCDRILTPEKNQSYYELIYLDAKERDYLELHLCSTYCLNKTVSELSVDNTIGGIDIHEWNLREEKENERIITILDKR